MNGTGHTCNISVSAAQFCWEPKTPLKKKESRLKKEVKREDRM